MVVAMFDQESTLRWPQGLSAKYARSLAHKSRVAKSFTKLNSVKNKDQLERSGTLSEKQLAKGSRQRGPGSGLSTPPTRGEQGSSVPGIATSDPHIFTPEEQAALDAHHTARMRVIRQVELLLEGGRPLNAVIVLENRLRDHPIDRAIIASWLADAYFRLGLNVRAYELLAPLANPYAMDRNLLRASLAASRRGEVYPGQRQYCVRLICTRFYEEMAQEVLSSSVPTGSSSRDVMLMSLLAIGLESSAWEHNEVYYYGQALSMDANNPLALWKLGDIHLRNERWAQAVTSYERALFRAQGPMRGPIEQNLYLARYRRDAGG